MGDTRLPDNDIDRTAIGSTTTGTWSRVLLLGPEGSSPRLSSVTADPARDTAAGMSSLTSDLRARGEDAFTGTTTGVGSVLGLVPDEKADGCFDSALCRSLLAPSDESG